MECIFKRVNSKNCLFFFRCQGIYETILKLGGKEELAHKFSQYILGISFLHKLRDELRDTKKRSILSRLKRFVIKISYTSLGKIFKDIYKLNHSLEFLENMIEVLEESEEVADPMIYFNQVGRAYGIIFKCIGINLRLNNNQIKDIQKIGDLIGTLVAMRDSIIDLQKDRISGNFNPFKSWKFSKMKKFYNNYINNMKNAITQFQSPKNHCSVNKTKNSRSEAIINNLSNYIITKKLLAFPVIPAFIASSSTCDCSNCCNDCCSSCCTDCSNDCKTSCDSCPSCCTCSPDCSGIASLSTGFIAGLIISSIFLIGLIIICVMILRARS
ncbi:MAG: hypothetical protein EU548_04525 [Promethearchaeota archaeon]|nr:MAG: hypothetical protein EU548_04525 [Candidatus Lokiarchaeota archaeon]